MSTTAVIERLKLAHVYPPWEQQWPIDERAEVVEDDDSETTLGEGIEQGGEGGDSERGRKRGTRRIESSLRQGEGAKHSCC
eukprot:787365-Rhodomonas_salina.1